ncbi:MAG: DUF1566 domain-containing protein [Planctomycetes bacterium]|nr:DUF1566 domain-containing protein [Planctomycetota bacterium]
MWQKDTADVSGNGSIGMEDILDWQDALKYCENLDVAGYADWRLPNVRELQSIVDYGRVDPAIDPVFGVLDLYWSSSSSADITGHAWFIQFYDGHVDAVDKGVALFVRAVRSGR